MLLKLKEVSVRVRELKNLGNYEHKEFSIEVKAEINDGEELEDVCEKLKFKANNLIKTWLYDELRMRKLERRA